MITIEPIINMHKIKYDIMKGLVNAHFEDGKKISIFINLDSILNTLYAPNIEDAIKSYQNYDNMILSSELINVVAHYRHFFWSYYKVPSKIYLYQMNTQPVYNSDLINNYAKSQIKKNTDNGRFVANNMRLVMILAAYIQKVYCIPCDGLEPSLIPYYIMKKTKDDDNLNLVITKDPYDYQLVNFKNTHILRLKYDDSYIVNKYNLYDTLLKKVKYRPKIDLSTELYSLIMAFGGITTRDIKSFKGHGMVNTMKKLEKLINKNKIANMYNSNIGNICEELNLDDEDYITINKRFKAIDLKNQYANLTKYDKEKISMKLIDRYDNISLMEVSHKYYTKNPLQIIELCEGV